MPNQLKETGLYDSSAWVADEKDDDGKWIYNNGYPILKWQTTK